MEVTPNLKILAGTAVRGLRTVGDGRGGGVVLPGEWETDGQVRAFAGYIRYQLMGER